MNFSTDDERWPYMAVVVWIVTRSFERTRWDARGSFSHFDGDLSSRRNGVAGFLPNGLSPQQARIELANNLERGELSGIGSRILPASSLVEPSFLNQQTLTDGNEEPSLYFPPSDDPRLLFKLKDIDYGPIGYRRGLYETPFPNSTCKIEWRKLTFPRADVLRLWPEHPQILAYRLAKATPWTRPAGVDTAALALLPEGKRVPLSPVVNLLAFAQVDPPAELSEVERATKRMQAANALFAVARDDGVNMFGTLAKKRACRANPPEPAGPPGPISPLEFDNDALALSHQQESAIGARFVAESYAEQGNHPDGVKWFGVTVERKDLEDWLGPLTNKAPNACGIKGKGGRPNAVDWTVIGKEVIRLMDEYDEFGADLPEWNAQARLEEKIEEFCVKKFKKRPARSTIQTHIKPLLARWRNSQPRPTET